MARPLVTSQVTYQWPCSQAKLERYKDNLDQTRVEAEADAHSLETEVREKMGEIADLDHANKQLLARLGIMGWRDGWKKYFCG